MPSNTDGNKCPKCTSLLVGRHCLAASCGFSRRTAEEKAKYEKPHKKLEPGDGAALLALSAKYRLSFPETRLGYDVLPWRDGKRRKGRLPSFDMPVTLLATNGVVAWFLREDETTFWGHLLAFELDKGEAAVPAFWRVGGDKKPRGESKAKRVSKLLEDL